jgi:hypothetical protein
VPELVDRWRCRHHYSNTRVILIYYSPTETSKLA